MSQVVRVLILDDSQLGAEAILRAVKEAGLTAQGRMVHDRAGFQSALTSESWDAIVSDYVMPGFNGRDALDLYRQMGMDIPFICVSGEISGEEAAEIVRAGAHDYLSKSHLAKLGGVLRRELAAASIRRQARRADELSAHLAAIVQGSDDAIFSKDLNGTVLSWNASAERIYGFAADEIVGKSILAIVPDSHREEEKRFLEKLRQGERVERVETVRVRKDGTELHVSLTISPIRNRAGEVIGASSISRDITDRHQMELERAALIRELQEALSKVKLLSGLLPICANCKKIRDEKGSWQEVEVYVHSHSQADFTHGICPECAHRLYPDIAQRKLVSESTGAK